MRLDRTHSGSGARLWPASRQNHPKQLPTLAGPGSLLQETTLCLRSLAAVLAADPVVGTNEEYRFVVAGQRRKIGVAEPRIVLEPVGRNAAHAVTLAALPLDGAGGSESAGSDHGLIFGCGTAPTPVVWAAHGCSPRARLNWFPLWYRSDHLLRDNNDWSPS